MNLNLKKVGMMLLIAVVFTLPPFSLVSVMKVYAQGALPRAGSAALTNQDILDILKMGLTQEVVIAKIKGSASNFDTSARGLQELKTAGVSDAVILAMVQAEVPLPSLPSIFTPATFSTPIGVAIPDGAPVAIGQGKDAPKAKALPGSKIFIAPMEGNLHPFLAAEIIKKKLPVTVVTEEKDADFILTGASIKGDDRWFHTVFGGKDKNEGSVQLISVADKTLVWAGEAGDRSLWWGNLSRGGQRKVADRIISKMKKQLFED